MSANSDERFYKRKLNDFDAELKRLQRELQKLKIMKRSGGRARKQLMRSLQREMELNEVFESIDGESFEDIQVDAEPQQDFSCTECHSEEVQLVPAGIRTIVVCQDCKCRYTITNDKLARSA